MRNKNELNKALLNLSRAGYTLKVRHLRRVIENDNLVTKGEAKRLGFTINPRGGLTEVMLFNPEGGLVARANARTSDLDNFYTTRGLLIAVGRLVKQRNRDVRTGDIADAEAAERSYAGF